jgi:hypothetical protein
MKKAFILFCSSFIILSCAGSKNSSTIPVNAPNWVYKTPLSSLNYLGIGMAPKTSTDYREKAQKMALTEISNSISVTVSSNNSLNVFQYDNTFNEFYRMNSMVSSASFIEGYDIIDNFEDKNYYYVYISLSKQKYESLKRARIKKALESSLFKFDYAKKMLEQKNFSEGINQQIYALEDISEVLNEDLRFIENGDEKPYVSILMNSIFSTFNQVEIVFPFKELNINHAKDRMEISIFPILANIQGEALGNFPLKSNYSWLPGQSQFWKTENSGIFGINLTRNFNKKTKERITIYVDVPAFVKSISQNNIVRKIFENYQPKKFELPINKTLPVFEVNFYAIDQTKKRITNLEEQLICLLESDFFTKATNEKKSDFQIAIESKKLENQSLNGKTSIKLEAKITITNRSKQIIYQEIIHNLIGLGNTLELAEQDAVNSLLEKIEIVYYKPIVQAML